MATRFLSGAAGADQFLNDRFQRSLAHWNHARLAPQFPTEDWQKDLDRDLKMQRLEGGFLEELRAEVVGKAAEAPADPGGFIGWFEALE